MRLSPQELIDYNEPSEKTKAEKKNPYDSVGCYPLSINQAFRYIIKNGISLEDHYPFRAKRGPPQLLNMVYICVVAFSIWPNRTCLLKLLRFVNMEPLIYSITLLYSFFFLGLAFDIIIVVSRKGVEEVHPISSSDSQWR